MAELGAAAEITSGGDKAEDTEEEKKIWRRRPWCRRFRAAAVFGGELRRRLVRVSDSITRKQENVETNRLGLTEFSRKFLHKTNRKMMNGSTSKLARGDENSVDSQRRDNGAIRLHDPIYSSRVGWVEIERTRTTWFEAKLSSEAA